MKLDDPRRFVSIAEIADLLNAFFKPDPPVGQATPYIWWHRSKANLDISLPMPRPSMVLGRTGAERPYWFQEALLHWYGAWRGIEVPVSLAAGDRHDTNGRLFMSEYRAK